MLRNSKIARGVALLALLCAAAVSWLAYDYWAFLHRPAMPVMRTAEVEIPSGASLGTIAQRLADVGMIANARWFKIRARRLGLERSLKPGRYALHARMFPDEILKRLQRGVVELVEATVPEGIRYLDIAALMEEAGLADAEAFAAACEDRTLIQRLLPGISPTPPHLEGYLFPETYKFRAGSSPEEIIAHMVETFRKHFTPALREAARGLGLSVAEAVTLASIIEKETARSDERKIVSSVMRNRLDKEMRLQVDPTVIYGIDAFDGNITRAHLRDKTPYNTYRIEGLPPTPICSPGLASLEAAVFPAETDYLYYVSRNDGSHKFSKTYEEHMKGVNRYQR